MSIIKSIMDRQNEIGFKNTAKLALRYGCAICKRKIDIIRTLPYSIPGLIDYHFNPKALKQSEIEPFIDNEKINAKVLQLTFICRQIRTTLD